MTVNVAEQIIDWLYAEQLQIDDEWSVRTGQGFTWWPDQNAQTIEIAGEQTGPDGRPGYLISVRTEMVADLDLSADALLALNEGPMRTAAMAGPVYDPEARTLSLCSLARVHEEIAGWMGVLLSSAAVMQIAEARLLGPDLAAALGARPAVSAHPRSGLRGVPDEMLFASQVFVAEGRQPCQWPESAFTEAVAYMMRPPSVGASSGGQGFTVEFPFGSRSSLCQVIGDQPHPLYGNGLLVLQRFPFPGASPAEGAEFALRLNSAELRTHPTGYGFGSYVYDDVYDSATLCFTGFVPNSLHRQVALPNLYFSCAARAQAMSLWLLDEAWDEDSFTPDHSAIVRAARSEPPADQ